MNIFEDFYEELPMGSIEAYLQTIGKQAVDEAKQKRLHKNNEVGVAPDLPPETHAERERYLNDFVAMHRELFPFSTGLKPFGKVQQESTRFDQEIIVKGGRLLKLEPRGYAKTTRLTNEVLYSHLMGAQLFTVIIASSEKKAVDILEAMKAELFTNDKLAMLFPGVCACFRHIARNPSKSRFQTYAGERTHIELNNDTIHFPNVPGEPSSSTRIVVRPITNLKGLNYKVEKGKDAGKVYRPTLYVFDDPQTSEAARSPTTVEGIITRIKRDALKGGTHMRPASAIMAITPVCHGDVASHFEQNEHSWDIVRYKMVEKFPDNHEMWMGEYAGIRGNFDRYIRGDRTRARKEAEQFVKENYDELHKGSEVSWEWAFSPDYPNFEVSAIQHAYNIILDDGMEDFEYECQCNTEYGLYDETTQLHAPHARIMNNYRELERRKAPQHTEKIVTHIDVNQDILTYATCTTANPMQVNVIDYGTYPEQPGVYTKRSLVRPLRALYPQYKDYREVLYLACLDLLQDIAQRKYEREDGIYITNDLIGIDIKFEENFITKSIMESPFKNIIVPCWGGSVNPDEDPYHLRKYPPGVRIYNNCVEEPNKNRTLMYLKIDAAFMKTEVHRGFNKDPGTKNSITLYKPRYPDEHKVVADHCNSERPEKQHGKKTLRTKIIWREKAKYVDNEFFDNIAGCLALFRKAGVSQTEDKTIVEKEVASQNIRDYINQQKGRSLFRK